VPGTPRYYRIAAVDEDGNIGIPSDAFTLQTTSAPPVESAPETFGLEQNYPNPFNPTTEVTYRLPVAGPVKLLVYDMLGREVAVLVDAWQQKGSYEVKFESSGLSSGVYLYQLIAGSSIQTRKMLLVR
jgi:hypothetical protein